MTAISQPKAKFKSRILHALVRSRGPLNRLKASRFGRDRPCLELYYEPGDPHSHLAAQVLSRIHQRLRCDVIVRIVSQTDYVLYPEPERQREFALLDAQRIAPAWGLEFPADGETPSEALKRRAARCFLAAKTIDEFLDIEALIGGQLFVAGNRVDSLLSSLAAVDESDAERAIGEANQRRSRLGHYLPGMWQLNGDWFWGVDRLDFLAQALRGKGLLQGDQPLAVFDPRQASLPRVQSSELSVFYSFRSPYSYLVAHQLKANYLGWQAAGLSIDIRPVLPMAMRGMTIPLSKRLYIPRDCHRLAARDKHPFGLIADPIGLGAERCIAAFSQLTTVQQKINYLVASGTTIWSQGVDVASDAGLGWACHQAGVDWEPIKQHLNEGLDLSAAEENRKALLASGLWGVPSFSMGDFSTWGQDRVWMINEIVRRQAVTMRA